MADWNEVESKITETLEKLTNENESLKTKVNGQEELVQRFKTEIGDARKEFKEVLEKAGSSGVDPEEIKKVVDKVNEIEKNMNEAGNKNNREEPEGQPKDLRKSMTKEQKEKADEVFKSLPEEERARIISDPERMNSFLSVAIEAKPNVPESLFDDKKPDSSGEHEDINDYRKLFGMVNKEASFVPGTGRSGSDGYSRISNDGPNNAEGQEQRVLLGGKIPRPQNAVPQNV